MSKHHMSRDCQVQKPLEPDQTILCRRFPSLNAMGPIPMMRGIRWDIDMLGLNKPQIGIVYNAYTVHLCDFRFTILLDSISLTHAWFYILIYVCCFETWPKRGSDMGLAENKAFLNALVNHNVPNEIGILGVYHVFRQTQLMIWLVMYTINTPYIHDSPIPFYIGWFTIHHHIPLQSSYNEITFIRTIRMKSDLMIHYS